MNISFCNIDHPFEKHSIVSQRPLSVMTLPVVLTPTDVIPRRWKRASVSEPATSFKVHWHFFTLYNSTNNSQCKFFSRRLMSFLGCELELFGRYVCGRGVLQVHRTVDIIMAFSKASGHQRDPLPRCGRFDITRGIFSFTMLLFNDSQRYFHGIQTIAWVLLNFWYCWGPSRALHRVVCPAIEKGRLRRGVFAEKQSVFYKQVLSLHHVYIQFEFD